MVQTPSRNIFVGLTSRCIICELCKKVKPRAAPIAILSPLSQDRDSLSRLPRNSTVNKINLSGENKLNFCISVPYLFALLIHTSKKMIR